MNRQKAALPQTLDQDTLCDLIVDCIQDKKGKNIVKLDLRKLDDAPTSFFVVCEGDSNVQVRAISDHVHGHLKQTHGVMPNHVEGMQTSRWVLIDYFDIVVHVFYPETRRFYELEDLWSDAEFTEYQNV